MVQCVGALVGDLAVLLAQVADSLLAVVTALRLAAHRPLEPLELLEPPLGRSGVRGARPVWHGSQALHAQVHAHHWAGVLWRHMLLLDLDGGVPVSRLFPQRGREHLHATGGNVAVLLEAYAAQAWKGDGAGEDVDLLAL